MAPSTPPPEFVVAEADHDALVAEAFRRRGYLADEVADMVRLCRDAARHGIHTHNALKALHLDDLFGTRVGGCVPGAAIEVIPSPFPAVQAWSAHRKPGPSVAYAAIDCCCRLADQFGIGVVSVDDAWHYLWGGAYVLEAARRGYLGYTQCTAMLAEVVPFGGRRPTLGTNPHSWAFPTQTAVGFPVLVDFATSNVAMGRVQQVARDHGQLGPGWAVDAQGNETRDPHLAAALLPFGAHKGFGLGLVNELVAALIGSGVPTQRGRFSKGPGDTTKRTPAFFFLVLRPEALSSHRYGAGPDASANLRAVLADILGPGNESTLLPGQKEAEHAQRSARLNGLLFTATELDAFDRIALDLGLPPFPRRLPTP